MRFPQGGADVFAVEALHEGRHLGGDGLAGLACVEGVEGVEFLDREGLGRAGGQRLLEYRGGRR